MPARALSGVKVIEFSDFISGPYCGKMLADQGAEVIKVERPGLGDKSRSWGPFPGDLPHQEKSGLFLHLNNNKFGITLNIETAIGMKIFKDLLKWADVLVEHHPVQEMQRLGLTWDNVHRLNPALVMTSITAFGQTGPYRDYKGNDLISSHASTEAFGNPAEGVPDPEQFPPLKPPVHTADFMAGLTAALCTLSAVMAQRTSGIGQQVDLSQQEALTSVGRQELAFYAVEGVEPTRLKGRKRRGGILYQCKDGYICMWIGPHFPKIVDMIGKPDWTQAEIFQNPQTRALYMEEFNSLMTLWTIERTRAEVDKESAKYGVPCSPVRSVNELVNDEQLAFRNYFVEVEHPEAGKLKFPGAPCKLSATPWRIERHAPLLGEHNEKVFCGMLGYSRQDLVQLRRIGAI